MKKILLGILIATSLSSPVLAQVVDQYKIRNDKEPDPEKYIPRPGWSHTETTTTTTTVKTLPQRTVYVDKSTGNNAPIQKCVKNGKTIYSNEGCEPQNRVFNEERAGDVKHMKEERKRAGLPD